MDSPASPFRAIDVLSSDNEQDDPISESWNHIDAHESGVSEFDLKNSGHKFPFGLFKIDLCC